MRQLQNESLHEPAHPLEYLFPKWRDLDTQILRRLLKDWRREAFRILDSKLEKEKRKKKNEKSFNHIHASESSSVSQSFLLTPALASDILLVFRKL